MTTVNRCRALPAPTANIFEMRSARAGLVGSARHRQQGRNVRSWELRGSVSELSRRKQAWLVFAGNESLELDEPGSKNISCLHHWPEPARERKKLGLPVLLLLVTRSGQSSLRIHFNSAHALVGLRWRLD